MLFILLILLKLKGDKRTFAGRIKLFAGQYELTDKEIEILEFTLKGLTSKDIADKIFTSEHTVKKHRSNIHKKTGVKNTIELFIKVLNL